MNEMTIGQTREYIKKRIDIVPIESFNRIKILLDAEQDCIDLLSKSQLMILDKAIMEADKGKGILHKNAIKELKSKWQVK